VTRTAPRTGHHRQVEPGAQRPCGRYQAAPPATLVGEGLDAIPAAPQRLREGISVGKYVVAL
jgi:hypothetical protein